MSDENPPGEAPDAPNPYGGPPASAPPASGPPPSGPPPVGPPGFPAYPGGAGAQRPSGGNGRIWIGIALAIPALVAISVLVGALSLVDDTGALSGVVGLAFFLGTIVMLFFDRTRKIALGLIIGWAVLFVLAAGACVALIASYN